MSQKAVRFFCLIIFICSICPILINFGVNTNSSVLFKNQKKFYNYIFRFGFYTQGRGRTQTSNLSQTKILEITYESYIILKISSRGIDWYIKHTCSMHGSKVILKKTLNKSRFLEYWLLVKKSHLRPYFLNRIWFFYEICRLY